MPHFAVALFAKRAVNAAQTAVNVVSQEDLQGLLGFVIGRSCVANLPCRPGLLNAQTTELTRHAIIARTRSAGLRSGMTMVVGRNS